MSIADDILQATLAYWDFDAGDPKSTLVDRSGNVDLPFVGSSPDHFALINGLHGQAGEWSDGGAGFARYDLEQYFDIRDRPFLISIWYYGGSSGLGFWVRFVSDTDQQVRLIVTSGNINFLIDGSIVYMLNEPIKTTAGWHHVLVGNEPGVRRVLYHDGVLAQSSTSNTTGFDANYGGIKIADDLTANPQQPLDEILVAELAPTDEIVEWLYNDGAGRSWVDIEGVPDEEEVFQASFEDASGRDPLPTALIERTPARRLANHTVIVYKYPPYLVTKRVPIALEDYDLSLPGKMLWHKDEKSALFSMGRWAQIQGRRFTDNPVEVELTLRISDHPESFEEPT